MDRNGLYSHNNQKHCEEAVEVQVTKKTKTNKGSIESHDDCLISYTNETGIFCEEPQPSGMTFTSNSMYDGLFKKCLH